ncbi:type II secretion system secretin GspD [uncultured Amphritea sp.]|uniref:type II secretion system secretin GspD n=1 Tax=uncultured Amphritea sp. TaxID=981605 RepID=UPI00261F8D70|nr:type II secretion system secretin GspD [uncultured Amphritea sp.]
MNSISIWKVIPLLVTLLGLTGCNSSPIYTDEGLTPNQPVGQIIHQRNQARNSADSGNNTTGASIQQVQNDTTSAPDRQRFELVSEARPMITQSQPAGSGSGEGNITLNFNDTDIHEVAKTILGDILNRNYAINDAVNIKVSLHTSQPLNRDALIPTLDSLLFMHGAVLRDNGHLIEIMPKSNTLAGGAPQLKLQNDQGFQTLVTPLRYIAAKEMEKILKSVASEGARITVDEPHNLLLMSGSRTELNTLLNTIETFDVNQLRGMSIGLFRLQSVDTRTILGELENVFGDNSSGPMAGLVKFVPIERLNTIMVITPQPQYLKSAEQWIDRLDKMDNLASTSLHVYKVKYGKASHLASMLEQLFSGQRSGAQNRSQGSGPRSPSPTTAAGTNSAPNAVMTSQGTLTPLASQTSLNNLGNISIIADEENNSLLVLATQADYGVVELALQKLDVLPQQVLVEATIVEVKLSGDLKYGIDWFFKNGFGNGDTGNGSLTSPQSSTGFKYQVLDRINNPLALLTALASDSRINVISSPSLMVLDNQSASIKVGDQVPISTSETTNTSNSSGNLITTSVQYRDTGVLLEVTPQIKDGGMVVLEINQDVSDASVTTSSGIQSPTINQRQIKTTVAVQSGDTLVLGGLIRENKDLGDAGLPGIKDVPGLGYLFGSKSETSRRTELVVMITPTAIKNRDQAREVTEEFKRQMKALKL